MVGLDAAGQRTLRGRPGRRSAIGLGRLIVSSRAGSTARRTSAGRRRLATGWAAWTTLGGADHRQPGRRPTTPTAASRCSPAARTTQVWHASQEWADRDGWRDWASRSATRFSATRRARVTRTGRLHVFARGTDNALWQRYQDPPAAGWGPWRSLGRRSSAATRWSIRDGAGLLHVVARGRRRDVCCMRPRRTARHLSDFGGLHVARARRAARAPPPVADGRPRPPPPPAADSAPAPRLRTINVTLSFAHTSARRSTRFTRLQVKGVPRGSTVRVTCAKGCSRKSYVKRNARGTVSIRVLARKPLQGRDEDPRRGHRAEHDRRGEDADGPLTAKTRRSRPAAWSRARAATQPAERAYVPVKVPRPTRALRAPRGRPPASAPSSRPLAFGIA